MTTRASVLWVSACVTCLLAGGSSRAAATAADRDPHSSNGAFERPEIVIPYVYGGELDDLIGNDVRKGNATTTPTPGDERRDSTHKQRNLHVFFYVSGAPLRLRITRLHDLTLRSSRIEWMGTNYTESKRIYRKCLFGGAVVGDPGSTATLDVCDGLAGTIGTADGDIYIKPVISGSALISRPHYVWLRRGSADKSRLFTSQDEISPSLAADVTRRDVMPGRRDVTPGGRDVTPDRRRRSLGQHSPKYLTVQLVTDRSVVDFHGRDLLEQYLLTQINIVNRIYHHESLGIEINVMLMKILVLDEDTVKSIVVRKKGKETLDNFCKWSAQERSNDVFEYNSFDIAVYLTKEKIGSAGFAPVDGMCARERSCALILDDGISSAFVMAHEIAHVMGLGHDGYDNDCEKDPSDGKLMSAMVQSSYNQFYWSECSRERLGEVIAGLSCLDDRPHETVWPKIAQPHGRSWSLNKQCRQEFGAGYRVCHALMGKEPCKQLWCSRKSKPLYCQTKKSPPLPGTKCARRKWCMAGVCAPVRRVSVDGRWSPWAPWRTCSKECGTGVRFRSRSCNDPLPTYGGKKCKGNNEQFQLCNVQTCAVARDARAEQCTSYNNKNFMNNRRHHWMPTENGDGSRVCKLACVSKESSDVFVSNADVIDGTFCSYKAPNGICIKGKCHRVGCDGRLGSDATEDTCGVCGGGGTSCKLMTGTFEQRLLKKRYHSLFVLPSKARNIVVSEYPSSPHLAHFIAIRDPVTREFLLNGAERLVPSKQFIVHGTRFTYVNSREGESLKATGPLLAPIEIMVYSLSSTLPSVIQYQYSVPNAISNIVERAMTRAARHHYAWRHTGWTACSKTCGGGVREPRYACRDETTGDAVKRAFCPRSGKPTTPARRCNARPCSPRRKYRWRGAAWGPCSASCGRHGVQRRQLDCYRLDRARKGSPGWRVGPELCKDARRLKLQKACKRKACPAQWKPRPWSTCSVSCGAGRQRRRVTCDKPDDGERYRCVGPRPARARNCTLRHCPANDDAGRYAAPRSEALRTVVLAPPPAPRAVAIERRRGRQTLHFRRIFNSCPVSDQSPFCALGANAQTCARLSYRRMCCRSCRDFV